jgi:hypothetical protein
MKILLFIGQRAAHPKEAGNIEDVQVEFLPANTTCVAAYVSRQLSGP